MGCCGKKVKQIAEGFTTLLADKVRGEDTHSFTKDRIYECNMCNLSIKNQKGKGLFCKLCWCYIEAATRVKSKKCPIGKWKE